MSEVVLLSVWKCVELTFYVYIDTTKKMGYASLVSYRFFSLTERCKMASCVICDKPIIGKRTGAKTCSNACRSKAYYKRQTAQRKWKAANLDMFDNQDLQRIGRISFAAAEMVVKVSTIGGREMARALLDSMTDLLTNAGVNWQNV